jgi:hypothetical protein
MMMIEPTPPKQTKLMIGRSPLFKTRPVFTSDKLIIMDLSYTKKLYDISDIPRFEYICMNLVELDISGTCVRNIAHLKLCPRLSKLVMNRMSSLYDGEKADDVMAFRLDVLSECTSLTHLDMNYFACIEWEEDMIDIRPIFSKEFLSQLTTLMIAADTYGNRCPLRWLSMESITYIVQHAVNVRTLDISNTTGNLDT